MDNTPRRIAYKIIDIKKRIEVTKVACSMEDKLQELKKNLKVIQDDIKLVEKDIAELDWDTNTEDGKYYRYQCTKRVDDEQLEDLIKKYDFNSG